MSASNYNYVCFECRTAIRHPKAATEAPKCRDCGMGCFCLGYKVEVPKRDDIRSWLDLRAECERRTSVSEEAIEFSGVRRQHFLEQEILRLRQMPDNKDRNRQIKKFEEELARLIETKPETKSLRPTPTKLTNRA